METIFTDKEKKRNTTYIISSSNNSEIESEYVIPLCQNVLDKKSRTRIFYFKENVNSNCISAKDIKNSDLGELYLIKANETLKVIKQSHKNIINSLVIFDKHINDSLLSEFAEKNISNEVLVLRNNFLLKDFEKNLIENRKDINFYLQIFNSDLDLANEYNKIIECFGENNTIVFIYAQWKANQMAIEQNKSKKVLINLRTNKIVSLSENYIRYDFNRFCEFIQHTDFDISDFLKIVL